MFGPYTTTPYNFHLILQSWNKNLQSYILYFKILRN